MLLLLFAWRCVFRRFTSRSYRLSRNLYQSVFQFYWVTDITFVRAEGIAFGPEARQAALDNAAAQIAQLAG